jgi:O-acetyl-ADP-ribose deacetylase (regulator of RNase III)
MLRYTDTTVFNVGAQTIVNTVNCVGVMGTGLALEFQLRFPEMEKDYVERCSQKKVEVGRPYLYKDYDEPWVLNFPTKYHWKYPSKIEWVEQGLKYFADNYQRGGITSVAFPKLGCSNGGLEWSLVSPLMEKYLQDLDIDIFICEDTERDASGTEGVMVQMLNNIEDLSWSSELGIRSDIKRKIVSALPLRRFRDLRKVEGIGKQTYKDVFSFLYSSASRPSTENQASEVEIENLSLFEESKDSYMQPTEQSLQSYVDISEEMKDPSNSEGKQIDKAPPVTESERQPDSLPEYDDLFYAVLPSIEKALSVAQTKDEIAKGFKNQLTKKAVDNWLKEAEKLGKIRKLPGRPIKYIATSAIQAEQLECSFVV